MREKFNNIYIVGDLHGDFHAIDILCRKMPDNSLIIQVGDWGVGFGTRGMRTMLLGIIQEELEKKNSEIWAIRGNHDDPAYFPSSDGNIHLIGDYTYQTINGMKFLFVGGATSIDRNMRREGRDWWSDEIVKYDTDKCKEECDVLIVHTAAKSWYPHDTPESLKKVITYYVPDIGIEREIMYSDLCVERQKIEKIFTKTKPKFAFYGHFHDSNKEVIGDCVTKLLHINEYVEFGGMMTYTHDLTDNS